MLGVTGICFSAEGPGGDVRVSYFEQKDDKSNKNRLPIVPKIARQNKQTQTFLPLTELSRCIILPAHYHDCEKYPLSIHISNGTHWCQLSMVVKLG